LQGRQSNITRTLKQLVASGKLGKVLSSHVLAESGMPDTDVPVKYKFYTNAKVGANNFTIIFGHCKYPQALPVSKD